MKIGLLCVATRGYKSLIPQFIKSVEEFFLPCHEVEINLFSDEPIVYEPIHKRVTIINHIIESYKFPDATLMRYHIFLKKSYNCDYLYYSDIDMRFVDYINEDIFGNLVVVKHPGYYDNGHSKGTWEERPESACCVPIEKRKVYVAGGINGGVSALFLGAMYIMKMLIDEDLGNGIIPIFHDESALNKYISDLNINHVTILDPDYCMPESIKKRIAWRINHFNPKVLALEKNFEEIRK